MAATRRHPAELRAQFGEIDIYLFDQLLRGRFDGAPPRPRRRLRRRTQPAVFPGARLRRLRASTRTRRPSRRRARSRPRWPRRCRPTTSARARSHALPWPDGRMDAVICSAVLHFARDRSHFERMIDEMWRVLAPRRAVLRAAGVEHRHRAAAQRHDRPRPPSRRLRSLRRRRAAPARRRRTTLARHAARSDQDDERPEPALHDDVGDSEERRVAGATSRVRCQMRDVRSRMRDMRVCDAPAGPSALKLRAAT